jgi:hypothetical protein
VALPADQPYLTTAVCWGRLSQVDFHRWAVLSTLVRWFLCVQWWASVAVYSCDIEGEWSVEDSCILNIQTTAF